MENSQFLSKKKLLSIKEEKLLRQIDYDKIAGTSSRGPKQKLLLDLEILKNPSSSTGPPRQHVLVSIKPRAPAIKTLYIAEKSRFFSKKHSEISGSRSTLGIGDHSSLTSSFRTNYSETSIDNYPAIDENQANTSTVSAIESGQITTSTEVNKSVDTSTSICLHVDKRESSHESSAEFSKHKNDKKVIEKCYVYTQQPFSLNLPKAEIKAEDTKPVPNKVDICTLIVTNTSSDDAVAVNIKTVKRLNKRIDLLERKLLQQEMVIRSLNPDLQYSSSDEECEDSNMKASGSGRPCCSYIQQYSHVPETSAFQRYTHLSPSKATTLDKEHNSEQYGRDFTTYDGITARGRRQSASVPCKRDEFPKMAAERVHKIRHKLNPVRDYRLMDTVHYLAQGEFAPRDDGIKLTPSREAVLSDIIWEDVCRTHWPNTRLGRRGAPERCGMRCELQRLIDSLLRERVAHVERRRRRHYRIVKLNHRNESCRPVGKTGDIIVASHKNKDPGNQERELPISDHSAASAMVADRRWEEKIYRKGHKSHDRLYHESRKKRFYEDECSPGPSYVVTRMPNKSREPTCCYHTVSPTKPVPKPVMKCSLENTSASSANKNMRTPRLVVKKDTSRHCRRQKEEPNLEQYILLPTLVIRTPSNVKRQKKFNQLYHRILNVQINNAEECSVATEAAARNPNPSNALTKDIGFNINILTSSEEDFNKNSKPM